MKATVQEIAAALHIARRVADRKLSRVPYEMQTGRGGRRKVYASQTLPTDIQAALARAQFVSLSAAASRPPAAELPPGESAGPSSSTNHRSARDAEDLSTWFDRHSQKRKDRAAWHLQMVHAYLSLTHSGVAARQAQTAIAHRFGTSVSTLGRDLGEIEGAPEHMWLYLLVDDYQGRSATSEMSAEAWEILKADFLRRERPAASACIARLRKMVVDQARDWTIPSTRTLLRRLRQIQRATRVLAREGEKALKRLYPSQQRAKGALRALQIVNADGYKHNVWVRFPDGEVIRAKTWFWQDVFSSKLLAWRTDKTEHTDMIRLAFGDLVERWGIPDAATLDNTLAAANKTMSGGVRHRFRFKVRDEEPDGVFKTLGVDLHWATPGHGQAKPVERAFGVGGVGEYIDKAPELAGCWTGGNPMDKPEYSARGVSKPKAVDLAILQEVIAREVAAWNAREGRRGSMTHGRSIDAVFDESYAMAPIRRATEAQRRMWLLATEPVRAGRAGALTLDAGRVVGERLSNRYWSARLTDYAGELLAARFDPQRLHEGVHVYSADGRYICFAECDRPAGFNDQVAGRERARARNTFVRKAKLAAAATQRMDVLDVVRARAGDGGPVIPAPSAPARSVIRAEFGRKSDEAIAADARMLARLEAEAAAPQPATVHRLQTPHEMHAYWLALAPRVREGEALSADDARFFCQWPADMYFRTMAEGDPDLQAYLPGKAASA